MSSESKARSWAVSAVWILAGLAMFGAVATLRAVMDGQRELAASDAAFDQNDLHGAIAHARRAASAYVPGAPHVADGYARLLAVARGAEASGKPDIAMLAWQAQRAAVLESASIVQPSSARLEEADRNLARLAALKVAAEPERAELAQRLFKEAQRRGTGQTPLGALLAVGLLFCGLGLAWFGARGLTPSGKLSLRGGRWGLITFALGAALWAFAAFNG